MICLTRSAQIGLFLAAVLWCPRAMAQDRYKYDSIAAKYKGELAVYTDYCDRLVISEENGHLVANSNVRMEKLYIGDLSLNNNNTDGFYYSDFDVLTTYSGVAYLPENGGYKAVKCSRFNESTPKTFMFYDDERAVQAVYSGLSKNAITETKYTQKHTDPYLLPCFYFNESIPMLKATFEVVAPKYVNLEFGIKGTGTDIIKQTTEEKNGLVTYRFSATNVPGSKKYDDVPSHRYYVPHVVPYIKSYRLTGAAKDSMVLRSPDELYRYNYKFVKGLNLNTDEQLNNTVAELVKGTASDKQKAKNIYEWVQKNIHYVAFEKGLQGFIPRQADTVFKRKYGDCKDMASILMAMCRKAGLNATWAWIGSNQLPYSVEDMPTLITTDHMICALNLDGEWMFMDGTDNTIPFGTNRVDLQGKEAIIAIDAAKYKIVKIPAAGAENNTTYDSTVIRLSDYSISGNIVIAHAGYEAWEFINENKHNNAKQNRDRLVRALTQRGSDKYVVTKYDLMENAEANKSVAMYAEFKIDGCVGNVGKQRIVNMNLTRKFEDKMITDPDDRKVGRYYSHKQKVKEVVVMEIPAGCRATYLPKPAKGGVEGLWDYSISYKADKKKITLTKEYTLNTLCVTPEQFAANNKLVEELKKQYRESVVLTAKK